MAYKWHNSTDSGQEWEYKIMQKRGVRLVTF